MFCGPAHQNSVTCLDFTLARIAAKSEKTGIPAIFREFREYLEKSWKSLLNSPISGKSQKYLLINYIIDVSI